VKQFAFQRRNRIKLSKVFRRNAQNIKLEQIDDNTYNTLFESLKTNDNDTQRLHASILFNYRLTQPQYNRIIQQFPTIIKYYESR
jgi:hypothetical protein